MRSTFIALSIAASAIVAIPVAAQIPGALDASRVQTGSYTVDSAHTQVEFKVNHLGFNGYYGIFGGATGSLTIDPAKPTASAVNIEIPLANIVTTSDKLNGHLKTPDFFDAAKFPTATFKSTSVTVSGQTAKIAGNLTLKGVTKPVVLDAKFTGAGANPMSKKTTLGFEATTSLKRSDFGINYGIPAVGDNVDLKITAAFEK